MYTKTFTGIDGSGERLADEVIQIVKKAESLKKISFLAHSLGGLFARYAIAVLYKPTSSSVKSNDISDPTCTNFRTSNKGSIAGLEAINFITLATPHLGVRGYKQLPIPSGLCFLGENCSCTCPYFTGTTGSQLFLTDGKSNKPPLLLQMASDCEDGKLYLRLMLSDVGLFTPMSLMIVSEIQSNSFGVQNLVCWRTSSIRRESELVKPSSESLDGYEHFVNVEYCPPVLSEDPHFPPEAAKAKEAAQNKATTQDTVGYQQIMEANSLQRLGWTKIDVSFHSATWPYFAHYNTHVKTEWLHNVGAGVVAHVADTIKQKEMQLDNSSVNVAAHDITVPVA